MIMTQREMVLQYMKDEGSIKPWQAMKELGIMRLGARIWDLKHKDGISIKTESEKSKNRYGKSVRYARYSLVKEGE